MSTAPGKTVLSQMLEFYGLREHPFGVSPDPRFLYPSAQHREAMASLAFGIDNQVGMAALIAEPGAGKTTLLFDVLQRYQHRASTAFVFNTQCGGADLLRQIVLELAIPGGEDERDQVRLHHLFTTFVAGQMRTKPVVIIIDEAQNLENSALETLRLLSNFEAADHKLLHIILAGQPQLADKLRHSSLTQLLQRITMVCRLGRFSRKQMEECIGFRLKVAGFDGKALFSSMALDRIMEASGGVPRELNRICINAMQLGFATRQRLIGEDVVEEVIADLTLAKWIPEAELPLSGMRPPEDAGTVAALRANATHAEQAAAASAPSDAASAAEAGRAQRPPEPAQQPESQPISPQLAARIAAVVRDVEAESGFTPPAPAQPWNEGASAQRTLNRDTRRALLDAAAHRRRAAELRLLGMKYRESASAEQMHAIYPYKFAMGCVPSPDSSPSENGSQSPADSNSHPTSGASRTGNAPQSGGVHGSKAKDDQKTGT